MAFTTYLAAKAHGKPFTALPVFLVRGFHHGAIVRSANSDGLVPTDLEGRPVGVNRGYTVTTGVWARGILADEYGVDLGRVTWVLSGDEHVREYVPPPNVVPVAPGEDVPDMVASGELAAGIGVPADHPNSCRSFLTRSRRATAHCAAVDCTRSTTSWSIRDEVLAAHPEVAADVFTAFAESKRLYVENSCAPGRSEKPTAVQTTKCTAASWRSPAKIRCRTASSPTGP